MRILIVLPSAEAADDDGELSLAAIAAPYFLLRDGGFEIAIASPAGGYPAVGHGRAAQRERVAAHRAA